MITSLWRWFWQRRPPFRLGTLVLGGMVAGIIFWGGFNTAMEATNTLEFCISCHEMESSVYAEYRRTIHYSNRSGVRVVCADCHVPKAWGAKLWRKIQATGDLYHKLAGTIDTPEKFAARRLLLAERVWASMEANDSQECRNCHDFSAMNLTLQQRRPQEKHPEAIEAGQSCIDCHKGIAHSLPQDYEKDD